jgi:hypothetical protein
MLKHPDDDGDLSMFASGDQILFACSRGHFWVLPARQMTLPAQRQDVVSLVREPADTVDALESRFGDHVRHALGI